ncbi:hypothetical protein T10_9741 [Trichinella papuae]|uniref:Uncharacterized protein n=1 Tax=Trichinella papuae TaxID=268474 RepID=A0A0V1N622_9BILA|nr:hypothetical protein T10_9741 [Trichinella papuae]
MRLPFCQRIISTAGRPYNLPRPSCGPMKLISDAIAAKKWAPQIYQHRPARWWCDQRTPFVVNPRVKRKLAMACGAARGHVTTRSWVLEQTQELEKPNGKFDPRKRVGQWTTDCVLCDTDRLTTVREEEVTGLGRTTRTTTTTRKRTDGPNRRANRTSKQAARLVRVKSTTTTTTTNSSSSSNSKTKYTKKIHPKIRHQANQTKEDPAKLHCNKRVMNENDVISRSWAIRVDNVAHRPQYASEKKKFFHPPLILPRLPTTLPFSKLGSSSRQSAVLT